MSVSAFCVGSYYYRNPLLASYISKNNQTPTDPPLQQTNLIYEYKCSIDECERQSNSYIGSTTTTLSRRLTMHLQQGGPKHHTVKNHMATLTRDMLVKNTRILHTESDTNRLHILEALLIQQHRPKLNNQYTGLVRTLKLHNMHTDIQKINTPYDTH